MSRKLRLNKSPLLGSNLKRWQLFKVYFRFNVHFCVLPFYNRISTLVFFYKDTLDYTEEQLADANMTNLEKKLTAWLGEMFS